MKTELAKLIKEDGQPIRAIHNYLIETMEDVKGSRFDTHQDTDYEMNEEHFNNCIASALRLLTGKFNVDDDVTTFKVGDIIEHSRFGQGEIVKIYDLGDSRADVKFKKVGLKKLMLNIGFSIKKIN